MCSRDFFTKQSGQMSVSKEITIATISTIVYQYGDTATASYSAKSSNWTLPSSDFSNGEPSSIPTDVANRGGPHTPLTTLFSGTIFTDPYRNEFASPTPVWSWAGFYKITATDDFASSPTGPACDLKIVLSLIFRLP